MMLTPPMDVYVPYDEKVRRTGLLKKSSKLSVLTCDGRCVVYGPVLPVLAVTYVTVRTTMI
jgi:hypothetical protein